MNRLLTGIFFLIIHLIIILLILYLKRKEASIRENFFSPLILFIICYFFIWFDTFYLLADYVNPRNYITWDPRLASYEPTFTAVLAYHFGGIIFIFGFLISNIIIKQIMKLFRFLKILLYFSISKILSLNFGKKLKSVFHRIKIITGQKYFEQINKADYEQNIFNGCMIIWIFSLSINIYIFLQLGGIPLFDLNLRSYIDARLLFISWFQCFSLFALSIALYGTYSLRHKRFYISFIAICLSIFFMALLGARNHPLKIVAPLVLILLWHFMISRHSFSSILNNWKTRLILIILIFLCLILSIFIIGFVSKSQIYHRYDLSPIDSISGILFSDVASNIYYFDVVINKSGPYGYYQGNLLINSLESYIPGSDEYYANYYIGWLVGFRKLVSIGSTLFGPAFAEFGWIGIFFQGITLGIVIGYGWNKFKKNHMNGAALAIFLGPLLIAMSLGLYSLWSILSLIIMMIGFHLFNKLEAATFIKRN